MAFYLPWSHPLKNITPSFEFGRQPHPTVRLWNRPSDRHFTPFTLQCACASATLSTVRMESQTGDHVLLVGGWALSAACGLRPSWPLAFPQAPRGARVGFPVACSDLCGQPPNYAAVKLHAAAVAAEGSGSRGEETHSQIPSRPLHHALRPEWGVGPRRVASGAGTGQAPRSGCNVSNRQGGGRP